MQTHYDINSALYAVGIKSKIKRKIFLHRYAEKFSSNNFEQGIGLDRLIMIIEEVPEKERSFYGIAIKKKEGQA